MARFFACKLPALPGNAQFERVRAEHGYTKGGQTGNAKGEVGPAVNSEGGNGEDDKGNELALKESHGE
jgi:hypothetical protein